MINGRAAARVEIGGVERWARELAARLPRLRPGAYEAVVPRGALAHKAGHAWEQLALPALAARRRAALVYSPANLAPLAWPRNVVTIHDAVALHHPEWHSRAYVAWQRRVLPRVAQGALAVTAPSEFSKAELVELLGVPAERVHVVAGGVGESFVPEADSSQVRRRHGLDRPYVLCVATRGARKNLAALEHVAVRLRHLGVDLVVAGGTRSYLPGGAAGVRGLGYVDDSELPGLYAGARAFVLPSLHEGFGLTTLEAMACGAPVVATSAGGLPEAVGEAGLLVEPGDAEALADAVERAVTDEDLRRRLRAAGLDRARQFTWSRTAAALDALLQTDLQLARI